MRDQLITVGRASIANLAVAALLLFSMRIDGSAASEADGARLFHHETFGGNGRTCETCHSDQTGTLSPLEVEAAFQADSGGPLFRPIDSDAGDGASYERLRKFATFRVKIDLPPNLTVLEEPDARAVFLFRSVPSNLNGPALDPKLLWDGRAATLEEQAAGAIATHAEASVEADDPRLADIAEFQRSLFSSAVLRDFAAGRPEPMLPDGTTPSEVRGRKLFDDTCKFCHSGPMLNEVDGKLPKAILGQGTLAPHARFATVAVSEAESIENPDPDKAPLLNPLRTWILTDDAGVHAVQSSDPAACS